MKRHKLAQAAAALTLLCSATAAEADVLPFAGSMTGISTGGPDASCAPLLFRLSIAPASSVGESSLGAFTYGSDICQGPVGINGTFVIDFGVDSFQGIQNGVASAAATPGLFDLLINYTVLEGTGRFTGATGSFTGVGTADARTPPTQVALTFNGSINAPAVPEPATWALMLLGFGAMGLTIRRRRKPGAVAATC